MTVAYGVWAWWGDQIWVSPLTCIVSLTTLSHYRASVWLWKGPWKHFHVAVYSVNTLTIPTLLFHVILILVLALSYNKMIISLCKTKEIVFRRPGLRHLMNSPLINNVEQVDLDNVLSILLWQFCFGEEVCNVLKMCSQRVYLSKVLPEQGLSCRRLNTVFLGLLFVSFRYRLLLLFYFCVFMYVCYVF